MSSDPNCPSADKLADLKANRLAPLEAAGLRRHVAACLKCQDRASATASDPFPFLDRGREPGEIGRLAHYSIRGVLGTGGMAIVFDAHDDHLHRDVALKVLRPEKASAEMRERFLREARALASLPPDHIVQVYSVGVANELPYIAMERLRGETLEARQARDGSLPLDECLSFTRQAAQGLAIAHGKKFVHRDIKPANIWIEETPEGRFRRLKLLDFGIARNADGGDKTLTMAGQIVGTPHYMAPEQALGLPVDGRADLYSLGCVLYQMVTGHAPFSGEKGETSALLEAVIKGEPPQVSFKVPTLPACVARLIHDLMERAPSQRPASAEEVLARLDAIDAFLEGSNPSGAIAPPEPPGRLRLLPVAIGAGVALVVFAFVLAVGLGRLWFPAANGKDPPAPRGEPIRVGIIHSTTGGLAVHEKPVLHATRFAIDEINRAGGVLGRPLEAIQADGASDPKVFAERAAKLIDEDRTEVLFGCWSSASRIPVGIACGSRNRLLFYPASYEGLGEKPSVVYLGGTPNQSLIPLVKWAYTDLRKRKFYLLGQESISSHVVHEMLRHEIEQLGGAVVGEEFVLVGETEFAPVAEAIKKAAPQFLINTIDGQDNRLLARALRKAGLTQDKLPTAWTAVGEAELSLFSRIEDVEGDYSCAGYFESLDTPANREFVKRYRERFPSERVNDPMQTAYFGVHLWKKAVEKAGTTEASAVRAALAGLEVEAPEGTV
ncbi:MAG: transporter substrate-binding protein, partial [Gemmataceae bacterium]|nr:transporter substrate-binding protein [Gemmataceae bacterium]